MTAETRLRSRRRRRIQREGQLRAYLAEKRYKSSCKTILTLERRWYTAIVQLWHTVTVRWWHTAIVQWWHTVTVRWWHTAIVYIGTTVGAFGSDCFVLRKVDGDDDGADDHGTNIFDVTGLSLSETLLSSDKKSDLSNGMGWPSPVASAIQTEDISKACDESTSSGRSQRVRLRYTLRWRKPRGWAAVDERIC